MRPMLATCSGIADLNGWNSMAASLTVNGGRILNILGLLE